MTPKVEHWRYPFTSVHKHPLDHLVAMGKAKSGYYPIGASGIWHGGVHFDSGTAAVFEQDAVQCIANGEVVAYRIDSRYPKTAYPPKLASFSTGFVLVRHRLEVPPPKFSTVSGPSLTFFSLYMHLRDWAGYDADSASERPAFWEGVTEYEVTTESSGLSVRAQPRAEATKLAELPKGTVVTVGAVEGDFRELLALVSGTPSESLTPSADSPRLGWVASRFLSPHGKSTPHNKDAVVVLPQPVRINAGDLIGHVGVYQQPNQVHPEPLLHLEVFSCEDVPAFMAECRLTGFRLADEHITLLKVRKGDRLIPHKASINADNPPDRFAPDAVKIGADFMLPQSYLDHLPATHKITVTLAPATRNTPAQEIHWWRLEKLLPDEQGNLISGWFLEQDLVTTRHSPWEWGNFECIRETGTAVEQHAYAFNAKGLLTADEQQNFRAQINKADEGPIVAFTRLHKMIDTDGDNVLSSNEIQAALGKPWQAQILAQLVTHYESEWFWSSKWDEMDNLMGHTPVKSNPNWVASKGRIQKLSWWVDLTSVDGIAPDGKAWHFHPLGMIGGFAKSSCLINVEAFLSLYAAQHTNFAGGTRSLSERDKNNLRTLIMEINAFTTTNNLQPSVYELAYMLATARHETYHFPTGEYFSTKPEVGDAKYFNQYDPVLGNQRERQRAISNGNTLEGDGIKYRGRGPVHLTWKNNYRKFSDELGVDFVLNPDAAAEHKYSVPIMMLGMSRGMFTTKKLSHFIGGGKKDYVGARAIINGTDENIKIASYASRFEEILLATSIASRDL